MIKDRQGETLQVGDAIWFTLYGDADIIDGIIIKFTNRDVKIKLDNNNQWRSHTSINKMSAKRRIIKKIT